MNSSLKQYAVLIGALILASCSDDNNYVALDCSAPADPNTIDCRQDSTPLDSSSEISLDIPSQYQALNLAGSVNWPKVHEDEKPQQLISSEDSLLLASKYHNRLQSFSIDSAGQIVAISETLHAFVPGERYTFDAFSGASEQVLSEVAVQSSPSKIYTQVAKYETQSDNTGVGVYASDFSDWSALPATRFGHIASPDYIAYGAVRAIALSHDEQKLAIAGSDKKLRIYATQDLSAPQQEITLTASARKLSFSKDDQTLYVGATTIIGQIMAYQSSDLSLRWQYSIAEIPRQLLPLENDEIIVRFSEGQRLLSLKQQQGEVQTKDITLQSTAVSIASDESSRYLAIAEVDKQLEVINLETNERARVLLAEKPSDVVIDRYQTIWVVDDAKVQGYSLAADF